MNDELLKIQDLKVVYKTDLETVHAVNGIELTVKKGKSLGIVGETGAGKTTTALSILKLLPHTAHFGSGSILFKNQDIINISEKEMLQIRGEQIAMIFQDPMTSLNPIMSIGSQIAETILLHNDAMANHEIQQRVNDVLNLVGISPDRKNDFPHQLSGGMKQRVVIAMALVCEPELLIADEPTSALDVTIQAQVLAMMKDLQDRLGTALIMITHNLGIVAQICDDVAVMYAGEIIESGTMEEVFSGSNHHPYTIGLFNSLPDLSSKRSRLEPIDGLMPDPTNLPIGCSFSPRCPAVMDICYSKKPDNSCNNNHCIKCHLFNLMA